MASTTDMAPSRSRKSSTNPGPEAELGAKTREQELEAQVALLQEDIKAIGETLRKLTGEKAHEVRDIAEAEVRQLKRRGQHMIEEAQDQAGEYEQQLKDTIREKPLTSVATALGVGFVLALLTR
ncbi:Membrane-anchored ribosome-binding protein, inhibits growth in stationary phase, ElaB/YqjD/DUF883 family [Devosia crocina]|uniref:Membrane-anchored ribosome-binding protein, inhibits growth in stationary phase, ElaB/YqjD/DUF883 family n=1 Tax=Devosia crocina TaxID=429728 RepID=A0A1I7N3T1_9HYPH|nr:DUF883 family protein [Devosia crocina]SFV29325.1 Membrane-anchored ribosome-binding protein, inhibits growth in stationary phase, ElaB/YqjD/DUF883 family [Devosia crocina]